MDSVAFHLYSASFTPGFRLVSWEAEFSCYAGRARHLLEATCQQNFYALKIYFLNLFFTLFQSTIWVKTKYFKSTNSHYHTTLTTANAHSYMLCGLSSEVTFANFSIWIFFWFFCLVFFNIYLDKKEYTTQQTNEDISLKKKKRRILIMYIIT